MSSIRRKAWFVVAIGCFALLGHQLAEAQTRGATGRTVSHRNARIHNVVAFSALHPVGAESGWGRMVVRDDQLQSGVSRTVKVWLFGLEPRTPYEVGAEGVTVGTILTDDDGDGYLCLKSGEGEGVPGNLPPAQDIASSTVTDPSLAVVLEGTFSVVRERTGDNTTRQEKIVLDDVEDGEAVGMACVRVRESDAQEFVTRASYLAPRETFRIVVDGLDVGLVTADDQGQAALEFMSPSEEHPLPKNLVPVSKIRLVQWFYGDVLKLTGTFAGDLDEEKPEDDGEEEEHCLEARGEIVEIGHLKLVIETGDGRLLVKVTDETELRGIGNFGQLRVGDIVAFEGCPDGDVIVANWLALIEEGEEEDCVEMRGKIAKIGGDELVLESGDKRVVFVVTDETQFKNFEEFSELGPGDFVAAEGCGNGEHYEAYWIMLIEPAEEDECFVVRGEIVEMGEGEFVLQASGHRLLVVLTPDTQVKDGDWPHDFGVGAVVVVEGCLDGEALVAAWLLLVEGPVDEEECAELEGEILSIHGDGFLLRVGGDEVSVIVTHETRFKEVEGGLAGLGVGDVVVLEGCFDGENLVAFWVLLVDDADAPEWLEVKGNVDEVLSDGFTIETDLGLLRVVVSAATAYEELDSFEDLIKGDYVFVEGPCDSELIDAVFVKLIGRPK